MIGIARGLVTTFKHLVRPAITELYPNEKRELPERSRGSIALTMGEDGTPLCKACLLCSRECPDDALLVEVEKGPEGKGRVLTRFTFDMGRCMYCGLCVEACTSDALRMTTEFEHASWDRADVVRVLYAAPARATDETPGAAASAGPSADTAPPAEES